VWIGAGGLAGTFARWALQGFIQDRAGAHFPWGTMIVNVTGSFLIGLLARYATGSGAIAPEVRAGLLIGFCGAYTTFSTYSYETLQLLQAGSYGRAGAYAFGSMALALVATAGGIAAANRLL
jgi:CrcB protein